MSWWRKAWLLLLLLLLWPINGFVRYALAFEPGAGPQGGEVIALLALIYWMLWQAIATLSEERSAQAGSCVPADAARDESFEAARLTQLVGR